MTTTEVRAKLHDSLTNIPEDEPATRESKRRIWELFKAMKTPERVVVRDEVEVSRLQQQVARMQQEVTRMRTEMKTAARAERERSSLAIAEMKTKAWKGSMASGLEGALAALYLCKASKDQIRKCLDSWAATCAKQMQISEEEAADTATRMLTHHLEWFAERNDAPQFVNTVLDALEPLEP